MGRMEKSSKTNKRGDPNKRGGWNTSNHPINGEDGNLTFKGFLSYSSYKEICL